MTKKVNDIIYARKLNVFGEPKQYGGASENTLGVNVPRGTTAERGAPGSSESPIRYNTTTGRFETWTGVYWFEHGLLAGGWDGAILETIDIDVTEIVGLVVLSLQAAGGGDLTCRFGGRSYIFDCTPAKTILLPTGTDSVHADSFVYITESGGVLTLESDGTGFPDEPHCPIATVIVQSAASLAIDGAFKVHAWTDHVKLEGENGHTSHTNAKLRSLPATHVSGALAQNMVVVDPDAYLSVDAGVVHQLHDHEWPARDMQAGDPFFLVNDPTTAYKRITTLDDITQDASGNSINNKYINLVAIGVVSENASECKVLLNLPTDVYNNEASAMADNQATAVYSWPSGYVGTAFLIARYTVLARSSGAWSQSQKKSLLGLFPSTSPGGGNTELSDAQVETAYNNQVAVVSQAEAEAGAATVVRRWTAERVGQAISALGGSGVPSPLLLEDGDAANPALGFVDSDDPDGIWRDPATGIVRIQRVADLTTAYIDLMDVAGFGLVILGGSGVNFAAPATASVGLAMANNKITTMADPTTAQDAATKKYADGEYCWVRLSDDSNSTANFQLFGTGSATVSVESDNLVWDGGLLLIDVSSGDGTYKVKANLILNSSSSGTVLIYCLKNGLLQYVDTILVHSSVDPIMYSFEWYVDSVTDGQYIQVAIDPTGANAVVMTVGSSISVVRVKLD